IGTAAQPASHLFREAEQGRHQGEVPGRRVHAEPERRHECRSGKLIAPTAEAERLPSLQRVAVTGATGFIGRRHVHRLLADGVAVTALSRRRAPDLDRSGAAVVVGSLEDAGALSQLVEGADAVVHAAGAVRARTSQQFVETNAGSTRRLIYAAARLRPPPRLLLLSSLAAREPMLSPYAASKRAAEDALAQEARGLWWLALRPPAVYGPGDRATLPLFRAMKRGLLPVPADGSGRFSLIHVDDLTAAIVALISSDVAG